MKWLPVFCCILFSYPAFADDTAPIKPLHQAPPPNVQLINGKKFFSLQNARHFTGGLDNPKALSVMHHPRTNPNNTIASRHSTALPLSSSTSAPTSPEKNPSDQVLSIFAPEDKTPGVAAPTK